MRILLHLIYYVNNYILVKIFFFAINFANVFNMYVELNIVIIVGFQIVIVVVDVDDGDEIIIAFPILL